MWTKVSNMPSVCDGAHMWSQLACDQMHQMDQGSGSGPRLLYIEITFKSETFPPRNPLVHHQSGAVWQLLVSSLPSPKVSAWETAFMYPPPPDLHTHTKYLFCNTSINVIQSNSPFFDKERVYFTFSVDDKWSPKLAFLEIVSHSFRFPHMCSPERLVVSIVPVFSVMLWCGYYCIIQNDNVMGMTMHGWWHQEDKEIDNDDGYSITALAIKDDDGDGVAPVPLSSIILKPLAGALGPYGRRAGFATRYCPTTMTTITIQALTFQQLQSYIAGDLNLSIVHYCSMKAHLEVIGIVGDCETGEYNQINGSSSLHMRMKSDGST